MADRGAYASPAVWRRLRTDPAFIELMRLARVLNSLALAYPPILVPLEDQSPPARRDRVAAMVYAGALLHEGLHTAQGLGKYFREYPQYKAGFASILGDPKVIRFRSDILDRLRDQLVFHVDRDSIAQGLSEFPDAETLILTADANEQGRIYYDAADEALLGYLFGDALTPEEYLERVGAFLEDTTSLFSRFMKAGHSLLGAAVKEMGCHGGPYTPPQPPPG